MEEERPAEELAAALEETARLREALTAARAGRYSVTVFLLCVVLGAAEAYFFYVTAGGAILN